MPNSKEHGLIGLSSGLVFTGVQFAENYHKSGLNPTIEEIIGNSFLNCITGYIGGLLPDVIEPSIKNPNHRFFFHSLGFGATLLLVSNKINQNNSLHPALKNGINGLIMGYVSHLIGDLSTTKGLPFIF